ncbi:hypothetical protein RvY_12024 [Ramazzottius varieornatus]|uniref:PARP catalytic domain-containing protein n=1 Tax=Ramazzottius varieornatus TaxID=947166 RepID=A0A1D1VI00_RAMVA|nr:hypothetical protein RvY_12024 [Ramazzottius varieornatus]
MPRCNAVGCNWRHETHHCALCGDGDSRHVSADCPRRFACILGHGTKTGATSSITQSGLRVSSEGRLGPGIYFATIPTARVIGKWRNEGEATVLYHCEVNLGKVKTMDGLAEDKSGSWRANYDSCHGMHPPWGGRTEPFREWVVKSPSQVKIVGLEICDGTYDGHIHLPGCWINISGRVTFGGNITAGTMVLNGAHVTLR